MDGIYRTTDHKEIKKWAIENSARPAIIDHPQARGDMVGIRLDFPGKKDEELLSEANQTRDISWDEFFRIFEEEKLLFFYTNEKPSNDPRDWYRFEKRDQDH